MPAHDEVAKRFWDREVVAQTHRSWMADPAVRAYINESVSGSPDVWTGDWFVSFLAGRTFERALSVGCGAGALERDLVTRGVCRTIDAFDGSTESIRIAVDEASKSGLGDRIRYSIGDFNEPRLPRRTYDAVFVHQAMHHVAKLEKLLRAIHRALEPGGILYLDEYVGPSRHEWTDERFALHRATYAALPAASRTVAVLPMPIAVEDPSEAIRSSEIVAEVRAGFDIVSRRNYGGNLLAPIYAYTDGSAPVVAELLERERALLRGGAEAYHAVIVAAPKVGFAGVLARARYFTLPKLKRIVRELRRRI